MRLSFDSDEEEGIMNTDNQDIISSFALWFAIIAIIAIF
jgi:hypothetical protein